MMLKRASQRGVLHGGFQKGVLTNIQRSGETASGSCGRLAEYWRAVHGGLGHPSVEFVRHGTVEYSPGTPAYSQRTQGYSLVLTRRCAPRRSGRGPTSHNTWQCVAPPRAAALRMSATYGYSHGTQGALPRYCAPRRVRDTPLRSFCSICGAHEEVWFVWLGTVEYSQGTSRYSHRPSWAVYRTAGCFTAFGGTTGCSLLRGVSHRGVLYRVLTAHFGVVRGPSSTTNLRKHTPVCVLWLLGALRALTQHLQAGRTGYYWVL